MVPNTSIDSTHLPIRSAADQDKSAAIETVSSTKLDAGLRSFDHCTKDLP